MFDKCIPFNKHVATGKHPKIDKCTPRFIQRGLNSNLFSPLWFIPGILVLNFTLINIVEILEGASKQEFQFKNFWMESLSSDSCVFCTVFTLNQESRDPFKTCTPDFRLKDIRIQIEIPNVQK